MDVKLLKVKQFPIDLPVRRKPSNAKALCLISLTTTLSIACFILGLFCHVNKPTQLILNDRLTMREFMPYFRWWKDTSDVLVTCRIFIFNVTNSKEWLDGKDDQLHLEELVPIVYREILVHDNVTFHEHNSTMSYITRRHLEFLPERNTPGILNKTIIVPNTSLLGVAARMENDFFFVKKGLNFVYSISGDSVFSELTIYDYLWNTKPLFLQQARSIIPSMVPAENVGILSTMYEDPEEHVNVRYGRRYGNEQFFMMNTYEYEPTVPGFSLARGDCFASIVNSSEGATYPQNLNEQSVLIYWRKTLCRAVPLYFDGRVQRGPLVGYKYSLPDSSYDRLPNSTADCFKGPYGPLEDGSTDISKCYHDVSLVATSPHFYARNFTTAHKITGMKPNRELHHSYTIVDPSFGIPFEQSARTQTNLAIPQLTGYASEIRRFSEMIIPMFWIEYHQRELPVYIVRTLQAFYVIRDIEPYLPYALYLACVLLLVVAFREAARFNMQSRIAPTKC
ncbi:scavenger receptor class B member 1-like isoform X1 [Anopheles albimanus]|uniref:scavenger receptor class B member 1-like isoform X1 n=1 Tax=Anopheles albimanus TaxID=7167 RepID=UPI00163EEAD2|nr:scavenger receptor class B member 1-like isoform X1 [Anopheles albimanus]